MIYLFIFVYQIQLCLPCFFSFFLNYFIYISHNIIYSYCLPDTALSTVFFFYISFISILYYFNNIFFIKCFFIYLKLYFNCLPDTALSTKFFCFFYFIFFYFYFMLFLYLFIFVYQIQPCLPCLFFLHLFYL